MKGIHDQIARKETEESGKIKSPKRDWKQWLPFIAIVIVSKHFGVVSSFPFVGIVVGWLIWDKLLQKEKRIFLYVFAIQSGHMLSALPFAIYYYNSGSIDLLPILGEITIPFIGLTWLMLKPGIGPIILLSVYQLKALLGAVNLFLSSGAVIDDTVLLHIIVRLAALIFMAMAYSKFWKMGRTNGGNTVADPS